MGRSYWLLDQSRFDPHALLVRHELKKLQNCMPNATNGVHLYAKVWDLYAKVWFIYYINVRQIVGREKKYTIVAVVWEKPVLKAHSSNFDIEIKRV